MRALFLALALALPSLARAEPAGPAATYVLAARALDRALATDDAALAATAHRIARSVTLRPAPGWTLTGDVAEAPATTGYPRDPGDPAVAVLAALMAEGDEAGLAVVEDALASPLRATGTVAAQTATLPGGGVHVWRIAFFGATPAEAAVVLTGPGAATFAVAQEDGPALCPPRRADPALVCAFLPAENGWFILTVVNAGDAALTYRLLTN